jgi:hypothetical protein
MLDDRLPKLSIHTENSNKNIKIDFSKFLFKDVMVNLPESLSRNKFLPSKTKLQNVKSLNRSFDTEDDLYHF